MGSTRALPEAPLTHDELCQSLAALAHDWEERSHQPLTSPTAKLVYSQCAADIQHLVNAATPTTEPAPPPEGAT